MSTNKLNGDPVPILGPSIAAVALWGSSNGKAARLFTEDEQSQLSLIASIARFKKGAQIYRAGAPAAAVFNIIDGVVKTSRGSPRSRKHVSAFLFADDLFGLAREGRYVNSAKAVTAVTVFRLPVRTLQAQLRKDAALEFEVICKLCHELREAQHHAFLLGHRNAVAKVAMFVQMLDHHYSSRGESPEYLYLPMSRSDVAEYTGLSPEAVSRSLRTLADRGVIAFKNLRHFKIADRSRLDSIALSD
jgi:CRP-like cAMP-binding protein